ALRDHAARQREHLSPQLARVLAGAEVMSLWRWLTGKKTSDDPKEVFDLALTEFRERYRKSRDLVASVLRERDLMRAALDQKQTDLEQVRRQAELAAHRDDDA